MGIDRDLTKAFSCLKNSANDCDEFGQYLLGRYIYFGHFEQKDDIQSLSLYFKSANQGFYEAQKEISVFYKNGLNGCEKNDEMYEIWASKAKLQESEYYMIDF